MKRFVLLHYGFETPTPEIMDAWSSWFASFGDKLVENVGPFQAGLEITPTGTEELSLDRGAITGFSVIEAASFDEAVAIAQDCPMITGIRVYEVMAR